MVTDRIEQDIVIAAAQERVWEIVTQAEHLGTWFADSGAEIDLRPGGTLRLHWKEFGSAHGRVETVDPPSTFAFRWVLVGEGDPSDTNSTKVTFTLMPDDAGTRLHVVEEGFSTLDIPDDKQVARVNENTEGWRMELDELKVYAEKPAA